MSECFVDHATRVEEVYEMVRHGDPPREPKTFDDVLRLTFLNVVDDLTAANKRIEELEAGNAEHRLWLVIHTPDELEQTSESEMFREADEALDGFTQLFHLGKWYYGKAFTIGVYGKKPGGQKSTCQ